MRREGGHSKQFLDKIRRLLPQRKPDQGEVSITDEGTLPDVPEPVFQRMDDMPAEHRNHPMYFNHEANKVFVNVDWGPWETLSKELADWRNGSQDGNRFHLSEHETRKAAYTVFVRTMAEKICEGIGACKIFKERSSGQDLLGPTWWEKAAEPSSIARDCFAYGPMIGELRRRFQWEDAVKEAKRDLVPRAPAPGGLPTGAESSDDREP
jgi:hypothetical protein